MNRTPRVQKAAGCCSSFLRRAAAWICALSVFCSHIFVTSEAENPVEYNENETKVLRCGLEESEPVIAQVRVWNGKNPVHKHTEACYNADHKLICGMWDQEYYHTHNQWCYDENGVLSCKLEEQEPHVHTKVCYEERDVLVCSHKEEDHVHSDGCYTEEVTLSCGQEEKEGHTHTSDCYQLVCEKTEDPGHTHTEDCYSEKEYKILSCGLEESEPTYHENGELVSPGHTHSDGCYRAETTLELTCGQQERAGHRHTSECYELACGREENAGHTHTESCYTRTKVLTCDRHEHTEDCYERQPVLVCDKPDSTHKHTEKCYAGDGKTVICGKLEVPEYVSSEKSWKTVEKVINEGHVHTDDCYRPAEQPPADDAGTGNTNDGGEDQENDLNEHPAGKAKEESAQSQQTSAVDPDSNDLSEAPPESNGQQNTIPAREDGEELQPGAEVIDEPDSETQNPEKPVPGQADDQNDHPEPVSNLFVQEDGTSEGQVNQNDQPESPEQQDNHQESMGDGQSDQKDQEGRPTSGNGTAAADGDQPLIPSADETEAEKQPEYNYAVHYYLKGTTISVADSFYGWTDEPSVDIEVRDPARLKREYEAYQLKLDSVSPEAHGDAVTLAIGSDLSRNEVIFYYTVPLTISIMDREEVYNGYNQSGYEWKDQEHVGIEGLIPSDDRSSLKIKYIKPTVRDVAESGKVGKFDEKKCKVPAYYEPTFIPGKITVLPLKTAVKITGHTATLKFNGAEQAIQGYEAIVDNRLYMKYDIVFSGTRKAARKDPGTTYMGLTAEMFSSKNDNFDVTFEVEDGWITIEPKEEKNSKKSEAEVSTSEETTNLKVLPSTVQQGDAAAQAASEESEPITTTAFIQTAIVSNDRSSEVEHEAAAIATNEATKEAAPIEDTEPIVTSIFVQTDIASNDEQSGRETNSLTLSSNIINSDTQNDVRTTALSLGSSTIYPDEQKDEAVATVITSLEEDSQENVLQTTVLETRMLSRGLDQSASDSALIASLNSQDAVMDLPVMNSIITETEDTTEEGEDESEEDSSGQEELFTLIITKEWFTESHSEQDVVYFNLHKVTKDEDVVINPDGEPYSLKWNETKRVTIPGAIDDEGSYYVVESDEKGIEIPEKKVDLAYLEVSDYVDERLTFVLERKGENGYQEYTDQEHSSIVYNPTFDYATLTEFKALLPDGDYRLTAYESDSEQTTRVKYGELLFFVDQSRILIPDMNSKISYLVKHDSIPLTITVPSISVPYNGERQYGLDLTDERVTIEGLLERDQNLIADIYGPAEGTYVIGMSYEGTFHRNKIPDYYDYYEYGKLSAGSLTITPAKVNVKITGKKTSSEYNGLEQTVKQEYEVTIDHPLYKEEYIYFNSPQVKVPKDVPDEPYKMGLTEDLFSNTQYQNFNVKFTIVKDGEFSIEPKELTVTTGSDRKTYDGLPLTKEDILITGLIETDNIKAKATGTITQVGTAKNTYQIEWGETNEKNYKIVEKLGTLQVIADNYSSMTSTSNYRFSFSSRTSVIRSVTLRVIYSTEDGKNTPEERKISLMTGDEYYVVSPMIPGYEADMEVLEGIISKDMIVRVKYKRTRQKLEIRYVTLDGMPAAETYTQELLSGVSYKVNSPEIPGYTTARPSVTGVMGGTDVTHIVVYIPEEYTDEDVTGSGSVFSINDYETPLGLGQAFMQMGICVE